MPGLLDHRRAVEALDQHAALVVHREVHRPDHPVTAALAQPGLGGAQQRLEHLAVVDELEEAEHAPARAVELVEGEVDLRSDPADDLAVRARR